MRREAHFPGFDACACRSCFVSRRVERVTNRLMGRKKKLSFKDMLRFVANDIANYQFGFTGWKQHNDMLDSLRYFNVIAPTPRIGFVLSNIDSPGKPSAPQAGERQC